MNNSDILRNVIETIINVGGRNTSDNYMKVVLDMMITKMSKDIKALNYVTVRNSVVIKSAINVVPQMTYGSIIIGDPNTNLMGGICNVNYFNTYLSASNIHTIYNSVKNMNRPIPMINYVSTVIP